VSTDHVELKALTSRKEQAERRLEALHKERAALDQKISGEQKDLGSIRSQIEKLTRKKKAVVVSEHAILRYLERVKGVDIEAAKKEILPAAVAGVAAELGTGEFPVGTHSVKVKDSVVVTILTNEKKEVKREPRLYREEGAPVPPGMIQCPKCKSVVDRLLPNNLCDQCTEELYSDDK